MKIIINRGMFILVMLLTCLVSKAQPATTFVVDGLAYEVLSAKNKTVAFSNTWYEPINAQSYNTHVIDYTGIITIPSTVVSNGVTYTVTAMKEYALKKNTITELTIPSTIDLIPANLLTARDNEGAGSLTLTKVIIEDGETSIKINSSSGLTSSPITDWYIGRNFIILDYSGEHAWGEEGFFGDGPTFIFQNAVNIEIGNKVTQLYDTNFSVLPNLENVSIGDGLITLPRNLFTNDQNLKSVTIGKNVKTIEEDAFGGSGILEIDIPSSVEVIDQTAFSSCLKLKKVTFHEGLKIISSEAFSSCESLESLTIPASVELIDDGAFSSCYSLTSLIIMDSETPLKMNNKKGGGYEGWPDSPITDLYLGREFDIENPILFPYVKNLTFGDNYKTIMDGMFQNSKIESLKFGNGITSIGERAFANCANLKGTIEIPAKVTEIPSYTFSNCYGVTGIVLPEGLKTIGQHAFNGCSAEELIIPASVTTIGSFAFGKYAFGGEDEPDVNLGVVKFVDGKEPIDVGEEILGKGVIDLLYIGRQARYGETNGWQTSAEIKMLEVGQLEELPEYTFADADIASISLGTTLKKIGGNSFTCCKKLKTLSIPSNVQEIGDHSFTDSELVTIEAESTTPCKLGYNVFGRGGSSNYDNYSKAIVYVPSKAIDTYKATDVWKEFKNIQAGWYLVSVTPNTGGTATLEGKTAKDGETAESYIKKGKDTSISLTFNEGYELGSLTVNGVEKKSEVNDGLLAISDIQEDKEVVVNFSKIVFTVSATAGKGGSLSVDNNNKVEWGNDAKVTITPNESYELKTITVNGKDMTDKVSKGVLTISQVKENLQVEATFKKLTFKITTNSGQGGSISVSSDIVEWGDDATITVTPDKNYEIVSVTVDGTAVTLNEDNAYIISSIKKNITVEATFESLGVVITIGNAKQGTYCSDYDINFRDVPGIKAYVASGYNTATGLIMLTRIYDVPAGMGIMLMAEEPGNYTIPTTTSTTYYVNMFVGTQEKTTIYEKDGDYVNYYLSNGASGIGFYRVSGSVDLVANRAYLPLLTSMPDRTNTRFIGFEFGDESDGTTNLSPAISKGDGEGEWYTLQGQRVAKPGKGLYIKNGKKILIK